MTSYINKNDLLYFLKKILRDHKNDNDYEDIVVKEFIKRMIKFIEKFPTTDIEFKNGVIFVNEMKLKEGAENEREG